jgi:tetratricopeptide (TPR) repeat protein
MNLLFHLANVLLLFFLLKRMTDALWPSAFVAALFAIHPLHVESVAWIAERKDVLSAFFGLLTLWAYVGYTERPGLARYLPVLLLYALGLMAKPMLVTLPFLMLLLDYWPLKRVSSFKFLVSGLKPGTRNQKPETRNLIFEKLPLFALAALFGIITFVVQQRGAVRSFEQISLQARIGNALVSYVAYLGKMIWPLNLAVLYPHPGESLPVRQVVGAALVLLLISTAVIRMGSGRPYLMVGWLWYLGTLVPVIGIVQVGAQAMADRYTYLPLIGIFIMIAWGAAETRNLKPETFRAALLGGAAGIALVLLAATARTQVGYWKDGVTLFEHALEKTEKNYTAEINVGIALVARGRPEEAMQHFSKALAINPNSSKAHYNWGFVLAKQGKLEEAIVHYAQAVSINPEDSKAYLSLGIALARQGRRNEAVAHYERALSIEPNDPIAHNNLATLLVEQGRLEEAAAHMAAALQVRPQDVLVHYNLGIVYEKLGKKKDAAAAFEAALRIKPDFVEAKKKLEEVKR